MTTRNLVRYLGLVLNKFITYLSQFSYRHILDCFRPMYNLPFFHVPLPDGRGTFWRGKTCPLMEALMKYLNSLNQKSPGNTRPESSFFHPSGEVS